MEIHSTHIRTSVKPTPERVAELDRLGDEIAELSAHLEAASARLLDLIREFDARGGCRVHFPLDRPLERDAPRAGSAYRIPAQRPARARQ